MKAYRLFLMILLTMALFPGAPQLTQGEDLFVVVGGGGGLLTKGSQITELYLDNATGDWVQILPNGSTQTFSWGNGKSFIMTYVNVRFYADTPNTHPYRVFYKAPNGTGLWITNLGNYTYPTSESTVWGGTQTESLSPGIVMTVKPAMEVRQQLVPPNDPYAGPVISGTLYMRIMGYVVP
jgi:hypothetical protein